MVVSYVDRDWRIGESGRFNACPVLIALNPIPLMMVTSRVLLMDIAQLRVGQRRDRFFLDNVLKRTATSASQRLSAL
jgi:hypothetical protein